MQTPYSSPPGTAPRIGEWLSESFNLFQAQWQTWVGQGLIYTALALGPFLVGYFAVVAGVLASAGAAGAGAGSGADPPAVAIGGLLVGLALMLVLYLVGILFSIYLLAGMERTAAKQLRGEAITVRDIFSAGDVFWPMLGGSILLGLAVSAGLLAFCVGALVVAGMLMFVHPLIVERRAGVFEAFRTSWEVTKPHWLMYTLWYLLIAVVGSLGSYFFLVGMAVTLPIMVLGIMVAYRDAIGIPGALPPATRPASAAPRGSATYLDTPPGPGEGGPPA